MTAWGDDDLRDAVHRFEQEHIEAKLLDSSVRSYVDAANRFLRWRRSDYRPRGAVGRGPTVMRRSATTEELDAELQAYRADLVAAGLQPSAVYAYVDRAARFLRWLDGEFVTTGPRGARRSARGGAEDVDGSWSWEGSVQAALVAWLVGLGWTIERQADTRSSEHGVDVLASRGTERLAVEVKGYPQATYARGARAGEPKRWGPGAQARNYFGNALHTALVMRDSLRSAEVAIALPDLPGYRGLLDQVQRTLTELGIRVFLIDASGGVLEPFAAAIRLPGSGRVVKRQAP